jgi:hypothetical protein
VAALRTLRLSDKELRIGAALGRLHAGHGFAVDLKTELAPPQLAVALRGAGFSCGEIAKGIKIERMQPDLPRSRPVSAGGHRARVESSGHVGGAKIAKLRMKKWAWRPGRRGARAQAARAVAGDRGCHAQVAVQRRRWRRRCA